jgi:hypothetical protein
MDNFDENEIGKLLRLKRYEQPPPEYFENFLHEFHRRQRDELLREPVWRIALQRAQDFMFRLNVPALSSGPVAVAAALVCAAIISLNVYQAPQQDQPRNVAVVTNAALTAPGGASWDLSRAVSTRDFSSPVARNVKNSSHTHRAAAVPPRYVLDSTPVSYEPSLRF